MGIYIDNIILYTILFVDDRVVIAEDEDDLCYMIRKFKEEYDSFGLDINTQKTE